MLDWIVVGGGIHGTYMSNHLVKTSGFLPDKIRVVDPHESPLAAWRRHTQNTGMEYLRSPGEHNIDVGAGSLFRFAAQRKGAGSEFYSRFKRPSLRIFNAHCDHVLSENSLDSLKHVGEALSLKRRADGYGYVLETSSGALEARRVILSIGAGDGLCVPAWAADLSASPIVHVFSPAFDAQVARSWSRAVVVGAGISGVQLALSLARRQPGRVTLVHSRQLRTYQFDADPCWLEGRCLRLLRREDDFSERRRIVDNARHWGSFPEDVRKQLDLAVKSGALICLQGDVASASGNGDCVDIRLSCGLRLQSDMVVLATGFDRKRPGGAFVDKTIDNLNLSMTGCGFPKTDEYLRWDEGLFVTGALAELVIGPASRNIVGARLAAERIAKAVHPVRSKPREYNYYFYRKRRTG